MSVEGIMTNCPVTESCAILYPGGIVIGSVWSDVPEVGMDGGIWNGSCPIHDWFNWCEVCNHCVGKCLGVGSSDQAIPAPVADPLVEKNSKIYISKLVCMTCNREKPEKSGS